MIESNLIMPEKGSVFTTLKSLLAWVFITLVVALLIDNRHHKSGTFNWTTPMWGDQAGYYVYLPGLFIYDFDAKSFPEKSKKKPALDFRSIRIKIK